MPRSKASSSKMKMNKSGIEARQGPDFVTCCGSIVASSFDFPRLVACVAALECYSR